MMRVKAKIDTEIGGITGHVIRLREGEERDLSDDIGAMALATNTVHRIDAPPDEGGAPEPTTPVDRLKAVMGKMFAGPVDPEHVRQDGSPKTGALRGLGADFDFSEADHAEAWKQFQADREAKQQEA